jgi:hypothetical protein
VFSGIEKIADASVQWDHVFLMSPWIKAHTLEIKAVTVSNDSFIVSVSEEAQKSSRLSAFHD